MRLIVGLVNKVYDILDAIKGIDFLAPLAFRIFLAPIFIVFGLNKLSHIEDTASWFDYLGMPFPEVLAYLAGGTEFFGGILLLVGLATRLVAIPLMVTMLVAAITAHWENGWLAIATSDASTHPAQLFAWFGVPAAEEAIAHTEEVSKRIGAARDILTEHGNYGWLTAKGSFVILNNGIEFAATYFIMLLSIFFTGAGKFLSVDYWLNRALRDHPNYF